MKIVQSFWSKPLLEQTPIANEKNIGGWRHKKYFYMSMALSCLSFKKYYDEVELVTDNYGSKLLIDTLKLPYTNVKVTLDKFNKYSSQLWAIGKLYAYSIQEDPFLHADNDVYIWERFDHSFTDSSLLAQHLDLEQGHYEFAMNHIGYYDFEIPDLLINDFQENQTYQVANAGIIGGKEVDFFHEYAKRSFKFINMNLKKLNANIIGSSYALLYEQYLFSALARKKGLNVAYYYTADDFLKITISNFMNSYKPKKYVHLLSDTKTYFENCRELEHQLAIGFPDYYDRFCALFQSNFSS